MKRPLGNEEILSLIEGGIKNKNLSHAYILCAPNGGGKKTLAEYIATAALCLEQGGAPCGKCRGCAMMSAHGHPDCERIIPSGEKNKSIKIDQIREAKEVCYIKPAVSSRRVFIIENAEAMTAEAQNALLKILEEPPEGMLFLLLTDSLHRLLPTVRSRCVILHLMPLTAAEIESLIPRASERAIAVSAGIAGEAIFASSADGVRMYEGAESFLRALVSRDMYQILKFRDTLSKSRENVKKQLSFILKLLRDVCAVKGGFDTQLYFCDSREIILDATNKLTKTALDNIINILQNLKTEAENNSLDLKLCAASALLLCWEEIH